MGQFVLSTQTILDHLALANGSVENAVNSLKRAHTLALNQPIPTTGIAIQYFRTADQERRAAADIIPLFANEGRDPANQIILSRAEAALLLEVANGDMDQVVVLLNDYDGAMQTLHIRYDGLRSLSGTDDERQEQADAMLAHLIHMTDRPDWWSVGVHLHKHKWNLVGAVAAWQKYGIIPVRHNDDKLGTKTEGKGRRKVRSPTGLVYLPMPTLAECTEYTPRRAIAWAPTPHQFATSTSADRPGPTLVRQSKEARDGRLFSSIIHHDGETAKVNCPDETKLFVEYIVAGKYKESHYNSETFRWPDFPKPNDAAKPLFDFKDPKHVAKLNGQYSQGYLRITGMVARPGGNDWSVEEKSYLYDLCGTLYGKQSLTQNQGPIKFRIPALTAAAWAVEYKTRFGTERSANALLSMARRDPKLCNDFGLTWNGDEDKK
jgi:hypothetical protein